MRGGEGGHRGHVAGLTPSLVISKSAQESGGGKGLQGGGGGTRGCVMCVILQH